MAAYIGADMPTLVQHFGVPDKQITVNGVQYVAYEQWHQEITPGGWYGPYGGPFYGGFYPAYYGGGLASQVITYSCETTFVLKEGKVSSFTLRGNDCN
ncbi:hypothetical protein [Acidocella sp.]|uniref:hypothetical protein n=1 Tax=Acidocella sp. TaxID=50710 RepID=UPI002F3FC320